MNNDSSDSAVTLSDVLIAFEKSLSRAQSHGASIRQTPEFYLGQRPFLDIDGLEVELKVGLSMASPSDDFMRVNFTPRPDTASSVRFRVKVQPQDMVETGLHIFRPLEPARSGCDCDICVVSIASGKPTSSKLNLHVLPRVPPKPAPAKVSRSAKRAASRPAPSKTAKSKKKVGVEAPVIAPAIPELHKDGAVTLDPETGLVTFWGCLTDNAGTCKITPHLRGTHLTLAVNGKQLKSPNLNASLYRDALIYASVGSATSDRVDLFARNPS